MQEYQINNNLNIANTIDKVTNTSLNNWVPYILNTSVDKKFTKKLLEEGNKISEQYEVKKNLASRISSVRKFNDELWISEGLIPYVNEWLEGCGIIFQERVFILRMQTYLLFGLIIKKQENITQNIFTQALTFLL